MRSAEITILLEQLSNENGTRRKAVYDRLVSLLYEDLRGRARQQMGGEVRWHTLRPTALVHEAYERLIGYNMRFENREHFLNVASTAMRRLLIDRARKAKAVKRGQGQVVSPLSDENAIHALVEDPDMLLDLDEALKSLREDQIQLVELRFFSGLTFEETGEVMGLQPETVRKRWRVIKTLLHDKLRSRQSL